MKNSYWLMPLLMLLNSLAYTFITELLHLSTGPFPIALAVLLLVLTGFLLRCFCSRKTILFGAVGLLAFSLVLTVWGILPSLGDSLRQFAWGLAYLWELLFFPLLQLPLPDVPGLFYLLPALVPFLWAFFCKRTS